MARITSWFVAALVAVALATGCAGDGGVDAARSTDFSGCRTVVSDAAFAAEIEAAHPLLGRMKRGLGAPGLAMAVAVDGDVVWSAVCGYADVEDREPVTRATSFRIGSVTKTLTAAAAARLAQESRLELDAPIQRYVPSFPRKRYRVTARALLSHTAGIRHYAGSEALSGLHYASVTDALRVFAGDPLLFRPGTRHLYSSYGFNLIGAAIEASEHRPFGTAIRRLVLEPLGLRHTAVDDGRRTGAWATEYEVTGSRGAIPAPTVDLSNRVPSGGFRASAEDLARFGSRLGDERFLGPRTQQAFFREQHVAGGAGTGYGLGFEVGETPFGPVVGHTGNVVGGTAFLLANPGAEVAMALTTNVGYVTAAAPPDLSSVPDPPALFLPFVRRASETG